MQSLRSKLILAFLLVSLVIIALVGSLARWNTSTEFRRYVFDRNQENILALVKNHYQQEASWEGVQEIFPRGPNLFGAGQSPFMPVGEIVLLDAENNVLIGGRGYHKGDRIAEDQIADALPVDVEGKIVGYVVLRSDAFREQPVESAFIERLSQTLLVGSLAVVSVALLLGFFIARSLTRPLQQLTAATRRVAAGDLAVAVDVTSKDELGELAQSFNMMNQRLAQSRDLRRQMTADIAHELRTPVSVILGYADGLKENVIPASDETFELIQEQAEQLEHLIEDLRTLTLAEAGELTLDRSLMDPMPLVDRVMAAYEPQATRQALALRLDVEGPITPIFIDSDRFKQILSNLLSNAMQYTPEGGTISVRAASTEEEVLFTVTDTGPGIETQELDRIFVRFYRRDPSRSRGTGGSGLGLSIAKSLVERQDGYISVASELGKGASFTIAFPRPVKP
jgi:two-component system sensor histidine kinase BaeS